MDPNANLAEQLELARAIEDCDCYSSYPCSRCGGAATRLAELALSLDRWIFGGGFLPERWDDLTRKARK